MKKKNKYDCINRANSWASAMEKQARGAYALKIGYCAKETIFSTLDEGVGFGLKENEEVGFIVFPTAISASKQSEEMLINKLKQKMRTISDRIDAESHIKWAIGKYLNSKYKAESGIIYGTDSLSIMAVGVSYDVLMEIAEDLCKSFMQEAVLVRCLSSDLILSVNPER